MKEKLSIGVCCSWDREQGILEISQAEDEAGKYRIFLTPYDMKTLFSMLAEIMDEIEEE